MVSFTLICLAFISHLLHDLGFVDVLVCRYEPVDAPITKSSKGGVNEGFGRIDPIIKLLENLKYNVLMLRPLDRELQDMLDPNIAALPNSCATAGDVLND